MRVAVAVAVVLLGLGCSSGSAVDVRTLDPDGGSGGGGVGAKLGDTCKPDNYVCDDAGENCTRLPECEELRAALVKAFPAGANPPRPEAECTRDVLRNPVCGFGCWRGSPPATEARYAAVCEALGGACVEQTCMVPRDGG